MKYVWVVVLVLGCRTQPLAPRVTEDLGALPLDLAASQTLGCTGLLECLRGCGGDECPLICYGRASLEARRRFDDVETCVGGWCLRPDGERPPRCIAGVGDPPDAGAGVCRRCVDAVRAEWAGLEPCDAADPDCRPRECHVLVEACFAD